MKRKDLYTYYSNYLLAWISQDKGVCKPCVKLLIFSKRDFQGYILQIQLRNTSRVCGLHFLHITHRPSSFYSPNPTKHHTNQNILSKILGSKMLKTCLMTKENVHFWVQSAYAGTFFIFNDKKQQHTDRQMVRHMLKKVESCHDSCMAKCQILYPTSFNANLSCRV